VRAARAMMRAMRVSFLRAGVCLGGFLGVVVAVGSGACGGNVVVDNAASTLGNGGQGNGGRGLGGGNGGQGGTVIVQTTIASTGNVGGSTSTISPVGVGPTTDASSSSVVSSTGTGPVCDCPTVCQNATHCGVGTLACQDLCTSQPMSTLVCLCSAGNNCGALEACIIGGTTSSAVSTVASTGATSTASSTSGGPVTCGDCANSQLTGTCATETASCATLPACAAIAACHNMCGFAPSCVQTCDDANPAGQGTYDKLIACAVCGTCAPECAGQPIATEYCP
jgi:hypothetical protein